MQRIGKTNLRIDFGGGRRSGGGLGPHGGTTFTGATLLPEDLEFVAGAVPVAASSPLAAIDLVEDLGAAGIIQQGGGDRILFVFIHFRYGAIDVGSFEAGIAGHHPLGADDDFEKCDLRRTYRAKLFLVGAVEGGEFLRVFAGNDEGLREDAELESVAAAGGLTLDGARPGGVLRVGAGSKSLSCCTHSSKVFA